MRTWTVVAGETLGYQTRWLCVEGERVADLGGPEHPSLDFAQFIVDACNALEQDREREQQIERLLTRSLDPTPEERRLTNLASPTS